MNVVTLISVVEVREHGPTMSLLVFFTRHTEPVPGGPIDIRVNVSGVLCDRVRSTYGERE